MITIHILAPSENSAEQIAKWLLTDKLVYLNVDIDQQETFILDHTGAIAKVKSYKLQARTKALLYSIIEKGLQTRFGSEPFLYSTPIAAMDTAHSKLLIEGLQKV